MLNRDYAEVAASALQGAIARVPSALMQRVVVIALAAAVATTLFVILGMVSSPIWFIVAVLYVSGTGAALLLRPRP